MSGHSFTRAMTLTSAVFLALAAFPSSACAQTSGAQQQPTSSGAKAAQRDKDFEHELVQSDGVIHPRETVTGGKAAAKRAPAAAKTQRDLDFEHDAVQSDGVNHPREKASGKKLAQPARAATPPKKSQKDLDQEHERMQSDGGYHPREMIKKQ